MSNYRVLLLESVHPNAKEKLSSYGFDVEPLADALSGKELAERLKGVHVVGIRSKTQITAEVLEGADSLMAIGAFCIGTNQIDLAAATARGVAVFNAPFSNTRSVAELVLSEVVMLSRQLGDRSAQMHQGQWRKTARSSYEVRGKVLGVIGYGHIGRQVGVLAEAFGMQVLYHDVVGKLPMGNNAPSVSMDALLAESDFVTLHVPETVQTKGMFGAPEIKRMKKGAALLNASRGTVVDIPALAEALKNGHLSGAAVDVFPVEPKQNISDEFHSELQGIANVVLTPHIGGSTIEAQENIGTEVGEAVSRFLATGSTMGAVNFPHLDLPPSEGKYRVTHVHENVPGVMRHVNRVVSEAGVNVGAQVLGTHETVGYVLMDVDRPLPPKVIQDLEAVDHTIRVRTPLGGPPVG